LVPPPSIASLGEVTRQLREHLNKLDVQAAEIKLARLNVAQDNTEGGVKSNTHNIPEVDITGPQIIIVQPATPQPVLETADELPKFLVEPPPSPEYKRSGLTLDLNCHVIPELLGEGTHNFKNTQEPQVRNAIEDCPNGDSKSPHNETTACDIPIIDKYSKPIIAETNHIINVPSPHNGLLATNQQKLLVASDLHSGTPEPLCQY